MAEPDDAVAAAQPAANPDAQTTVNDFLDYTEFFPSDLVRSLTLIGDLDATYRDAVQHVHELTCLLGELPSLPPPQRADPVLLRKQIAQHLQRAINQREYAYTEASRLYEVTVRHCQRSSIIRRKLQAQPEPPSRDPTPPPVSPSAQRSYVRTSYERPAHLRLTFDTGRARHRHRRPGQLPSRRSRPYSASSDDSDRDSDTRSNIDLAVPHRKHRQNRERHGGRVRAQGVLGTNVHSAVAGISTSNALAQLAPPPPDARPGSKWAPWLKLTEYEMAVLRKQMKKNAVWTPSLTMVNRELEKKHRTQADYDLEKARCEEAGEEMLDEEPESLQDLVTASGLGQLASNGPVAGPEAADFARDDAREDGGTISIRLKHTAAKDGRKMDRLSQRQQAMRDVIELEEVTKGLSQAAQTLQELTFPPSSTTTPASKKKSAARPLNLNPSNKRKRDSSPPAATESPPDTPRSESVATEDSGTREPEFKRLRLYPLLDTAASEGGMTSPTDPHTPTSTLSTPQETPAHVQLSPVVSTPRPDPEPVSPLKVSTTVQIPLAPAGPSTPKISKPLTREPSEPLTPLAISSEAASPVMASSEAPPPPAPATTAASSRPRRESLATKAASPPVQPIKTSKASTPVPDAIPEAHTHVMRPRSARGHVPTPKAQSEEPKPMEIARITRDRESRRHSIFSQSALVGPTRQSRRRKPPPKGEVSAVENGQKTVTNVKRSQGSKNKKTKKTEEEHEAADDIDPDEEKYCVCDDVSYGTMISCDNNCDREWFHMPCVNMTESDMPSRRSKWYCPDCRASLGVDAYGNPLVPPPLPGRRSNR
ncbi:hypothetical protein ACEQ8H_003266 [Pleosporales sp. CAS-2024a]